MSKQRNWHTEHRPTVTVAPMSLHAAAAHGAGLEVRRVFVTGPAPTAGAVLKAAGAGDRVFADGHFPVLSSGGVSVYCAAQWFGPEVSPERFDVLHARLQRDLRALWRDRRLELLPNPAQTGVDLWARTIRGREWPVMSPDVQQLVRSIGGQGRIELFPPAVAGPVTLYEHDMRLAYMAGVRRLPVGEPLELRGEPGEYAAGRYRVTFAAPADWGGRAGLLAVHDDAGGWQWPDRGHTWTSGEELRIARREGWAVKVHQGFEWPTVDEPMRLWAERLLELHGSYRQNGQRELANAARSMMLHTIGALHGAPRKVTCTGSSPSSEALGVRRHGDGWAWYELRQPGRPELVHPEWTTSIWARARARLADALLGVPAGKLVAVRTDAYYATEALPVDDHGRPGAWRVKSISPAERWPESAAELLEART